MTYILHEETPQRSGPFRSASVSFTGSNTFQPATRTRENSRLEFPRWPDTSTKSAFDVREWTQRVGKESCWEGKRPRRKFSDELKRDAVEIVRSCGNRVHVYPTPTT